MTISKVEIDRLSVTSSKSFEAVLAALKAAIGRPDMVEFANAIRNAQTFAELERTVHQSLGNTGLMMFMESTHHERNGQARSRRRVDERPDGVHLTYDKMASLLAPYRNAEALAVARNLDSKIETLLRSSAR
jgi:hypothetical protein